MRKLIALFAVLVLAASVTFADTYTSGTSTGTFNGTFYCVPVLGGPTPAISALGNYFTSGTNVPVPVAAPSINWTLTGDPAATYGITLTDPITSPLVAGGPKLHGQWTYASANGVYLPGHLWWGTGFGGKIAETPGSGVTWPTSGVVADLDCTKLTTITFDPQTMDTGTKPGVYSFIITVLVTATI